MDIALTLQRGGPNSKLRAQVTLAKRQTKWVAMRKGASCLFRYREVLYRPHADELRMCPEHHDAVHH